MKTTQRYTLPGLAVAGLLVGGLLVTGQAQATAVHFTSVEGYVDGDITNNVHWTAIAADTPSGNIVSTSSMGYAGAGVVTLSTSQWATANFDEVLPLDSAGDVATVKYRFRYTATNTIPLLQSELISMELANPDNSGLVRSGLRRIDSSGVGSIGFWTNGDPTNPGLGPTAPETAVGITNANDTSHWLELSASLTKTSDTGTDDWIFEASIKNLVTGEEVVKHLISPYTPRAAAVSSNEVVARISSAWRPTQSATIDRTIDRFEVISGFYEVPPEPTTIIEGAIGDGDFEYPEVPGSPGDVTGSLWYTNSPNWFNASGSDGVGFTQDTQMGASSQPNSRGGMPYQGRTQVNNTPYTIGAAGEVFSLSYDFGAGGGASPYSNATMSTFLFTAEAPVDGSLTTNDMTILGGDGYDLTFRAQGGNQWTSHTVENFYTSTPADVGKTVYFGMRMDQPEGTSFPRIDVIRLEVSPMAVTLVFDGVGLSGDAGQVWMSWPSESAAESYAISAVDLLGGGASNLAGGIMGTPPQNVYTANVGATEAMFYRLEQEPPPPLLDEDFESGAPGWTTGATLPGAGGTVWERGVPSGGPGAAHSGSNAYGTDLDADYAVGEKTDLWLRSPTVDLASAASATLTFYDWFETDNNYHFGYVNILDTSGTPLASQEYAATGGPSAGWVQQTVPFPAGVMGQEVVIEFQFTTDQYGTPYAGWYIDDVLVEAP